MDGGIFMGPCLHQLRSFPGHALLSGTSTYDVCCCKGPVLTGCMNHAGACRCEKMRIHKCAMPQTLVFALFCGVVLGFDDCGRLLEPSLFLESSAIYLLRLPYDLPAGLTSTHSDIGLTAAGSVRAAPPQL